MILIAKKCSISECDAPVLAQGLCQKHYKRWQRHGHMHDTRPSDWGCREQHPLYPTWNWLMRAYRPVVDRRWHDLWAFVSDIGDGRPSIRHRLTRIDSKKPFGPKNVYWSEPIRRPTTPEFRAASVEYQRRYRSSNPKKAHDRALRRYYGIGVEDYDLMMSAQAGVCAICQKAELSVDPKTKKVRRLAVDHCHATHKIRGLLCSGCNGGLGSFKDDLNILRKAVAYLERHLE